MTKAQSLLKRAELFEKLSLYGRRDDFLRALAQNPTITFPNNFIASRVDAASNKTRTVIQRLRDTNMRNQLEQIHSKISRVVSNHVTTEPEAKDNSLALAGSLDQILAILFSLKRDEEHLPADLTAVNDAIPDVKSASNVVHQFRINQGWERPLPSREKPIVPSPTPQKPVEIPVDIAGTPPTKGTGDSRMGKYYGLLQKGKSLVNKIGVMNPDVDGEALASSYGPMEQILSQIRKFHDEFPYPTGEAATMASRLDALTAEFTRFRPKVDRAYQMRRLFTTQK